MANKEIRKNDLSRNQVRIVSKTVQVFIESVSYPNGTGMPNLYDPEGRPARKPGKGERFPFEVVHPVLVRLARKIELASRMRVLGRYAATDFQARKGNFSPTLVFLQIIYHI